jgi:predicted amidohydrolase
MSPKALAESAEGDTIAWMKKLSQKRNIVIVGSIIAKENDAYYNRLICMLPTGSYGIYDKRHLFSFAGEGNLYSPGDKRLIASIKGWKINLQICYDLRFPVWARQQTKENEAGEKIPEYDILIYVANWPERRVHAWRTLLCARAIENQCYVIGVNRVGNDGNGIYHNGSTMIIGPLGEVLYHAADEEDICELTLDKEELKNIRSKFSFLKDGDEFSILP